MDYRKNDWLKRYGLIQKSRDATWNDLSTLKDEKWIITRLKMYQWSIDEILRHMLASEIRYVHQGFDPELPQHSMAVPAQWVGEVFFRFEEKKHVRLKELKEAFPAVERKSLTLFKESVESDYEKVVKAPWGEEMTLHGLLEAFYLHEHYHRGRVILDI
ncbi:MAG: DinB family protein [Candidatus Odinarchaeota archaeon]